MRIFQLVIVSCFAVALGNAAGCGGNVVVDTGSGGNGGGSSVAGSGNSGTPSVGQAGTSVAGAGTFMTSGGPAVAATSTGSGSGGCGGQSCFVGSDGSCGCEIQCGDKLFGSRCQPTPQGAVCECSINGMGVGSCDGKVAVCDVFMSCCGQIFGSG